MSLWEWALAAYARPGVPEACLELQDAHGQNTPLLLWAAHARTRDAGTVQRAAAAARAWDDAAVRPLRAIRRSLKAPCPPVGDAPRETLREEVKALELRAERLLLETLEGLGAPTPLDALGEPQATPLEALGEPQATPLEAMTAAATAWGLHAPTTALAALAAALE